MAQPPAPPKRLAPRGLVAGPVRTPLPYGLFSVVPFRDGSGDRWAAGVEWDLDSPAADGGIGGLGPLLASQDDMFGFPKKLEANGGGTAIADPFTVYGYFTCNPIGVGFDEAQRRATLNLNTFEEARVEQALWTGDLANTPNFAGANGVDAPDAIGSFEDVNEAISRADAWLAKRYGSQGVIHLSKAQAALSGFGVLSASGGRLTTKLGTPVVAGAGYGDDAVIATPAVFGYRSEVIEAGGAQANFDRSTNTMTAIAERNYLIGFEPLIGRAAITTPAP
jgi:hypothetical protein